MIRLDEELRALYPVDSITKYDPDHYYTGGDWPGTCMCGHDGSDHRMAMACDDPDCDCGDFEPRPGMRNPVVKHKGQHPFFAAMPKTSRVMRGTR